MGQEKTFPGKSLPGLRRKGTRQPQATGQVLAQGCLSLLSFCFDLHAFGAEKKF